MLRKNRALAIITAAVLLLSSTACEVREQFDEYFRALRDAPQADTNDPLLATADALRNAGLPPLADLQLGLSLLDSYRATLRLENRPAAGAPATETIIMVQEVVRGGNQLHSGMSSNGNPATAAAFDYYRIGPEVFLRTAQGSSPATCQRMTGQNAELPANLQALSPDQVFGPIQPAQLIRRGEDVGGVLADRYTVDQAQMGLGSAQGRQGEVWIAQEGGYVVRYSGQAEGVIAGLTASGPSSTSEWLYELEGINALTEISLPSECQAARREAAEVPQPPDASGVTSYGGVTTFRSEQSTAELTDFYQQELTAGGWGVNERLRLDTLVILDASRENRRLEITITAEEPGSTVMIREQ